MGTCKYDQIGGVFFVRSRKLAMDDAFEGSNVLSRLEAHRRLQAELRTGMADVGFTVIAGTRTSFRRKLNDETVLRVGVQILRGRAPTLGLFPRVGFINLRIDEFFRQYLGRSDAQARNPIPTFSETLGYMMPEPLQLEWYFEPTETAIQNEARTAVRNVVEFGMPFMTRFPDLGTLAEWAATPTLTPYAWTREPELLRAAIFYLTGNVARAKELISDEIAKALANGDSEHPTYDPYRRFEEMLRLHLRPN